MKTRRMKSKIKNRIRKKSKIRSKSKTGAMPFRNPNLAPALVHVRDLALAFLTITPQSIRNCGEPLMIVNFPDLSVR
jgi:hypothetical protein